MTLASSSGPVVSSAVRRSVCTLLPLRGCGPGHHPAAFVLALGLEIENLLLFELREGKVPEVQAQYLALPGQKVIFDAEPLHRLQMAAQHGGRDQLGDFGQLVTALLDGVQRIQPRLQIGLVLLVPLRNTRIKIPAVVVDARFTRKPARFDQLPDCGGGLLVLKLRQTHHHVSHLHASVVDVVLHVDLAAGGAQQANESIAEDGIAQMPDMRSLVRVDRRVLHQHLAGVRRRHRFFHATDDLARRLRAVDSGIDVAGSGDLEATESLRRRQFSDDLFGDLAGSLAQPLRQLKAERQSILAHLGLGRLLDHNVLNFYLILAAQKIADVLDETAL